MANLGQMLEELKAKRNSTKKELAQLDEAIRVLQKLGGAGKGSQAKAARPRRKMSAAARRKIAAAQKARWAKVRKQQKAAA